MGGDRSATGLHFYSPPRSVHHCRGSGWTSIVCPHSEICIELIFLSGDTLTSNNSLVAGHSYFDHNLFHLLGHLKHESTWTRNLPNLYRLDVAQKCSNPGSDPGFDTYWKARISEWRILMRKRSVKNPYWNWIQGLTLVLNTLLHGLAMPPKIPRRQERMMKHHFDTPPRPKSDH